MRKLLLLTVLAAGLCAGCNRAVEPEPLRVGFQLYSVRQDLARDLPGTLRKVSDMGFEGVEFYNEYSGYTPAQVRKMCDDLGLVIFSNHVPFDLMMTDLDRIIEESKVLGVKYITFPYMAEESRPGVDPEQFKKTVAAIAEVGAKVRKAGFTLLYHNHDFEFAALPDGTVGHDYIFSSTPASDVQVELDACWADYTGADVPELIRGYAGRIPVIHMKDYYKEGVLDSDPYALIGIDKDESEETSGGMFEFRPLGRGLMDLDAVIEAAKVSGVEWLCVEQDDPSEGAADCFEGPRISVALLRQRGFLN